jgi:hypothetical protein
MLKAALVLFYPLLWLVGLLNRLYGFDRLRLRRPSAASYWTARGAPPAMLDYFSQAAPPENEKAPSAARPVTRMLLALARLAGPRRATKPFRAVTERDAGIPDEIYTLW